MVKFTDLGILLLLAILVTNIITVTGQAEQQQFFNDEEDDQDFIDFDSEMRDEAEEEFFPDDIIEDIVKDVPLDTNDKNDEEDDAVVESDDVDEFSHLTDEEEFIGYSSDSSSNNNNYRNPNKKEPAREPKITIANVPLHLRSNWDSFYLELILLGGLFIYFVNFSIGRSKNARLAAAWFSSHKTLLVQQFLLVGDDGKAASNNKSSNGDGSEAVPAEKSVVMNSKGCYDLLKESENMYTLYCSGRYSVHSLMVELKFVKRQDLVSLMIGILKPVTDEVVIKLRLDDMESFVFCLATKKVTAKYVKEMNDLTTFCPGDRKTTLPTKQYGSGGAKISVYSELSEASQALLMDPRVVAVLGKNLARVNYLHISDQYSGPKPQDQDQSSNAGSLNNMPEVHKMVILSIQLPNDNAAGEDNMEQLQPLMNLVLYLADKLARFKLSKEGKNKATRNRSRVEEVFMKATHAARAERAQEKREEKKREEREKIMEADDPERQRKWEERENRRIAKKKVPKMKQLKIT